MKDIVILLIHLLTTAAKLLGPDGAKAIIAENLLLKQQLLVVTRSRWRAPNLSTPDRFLMGFWSLFLRPGRIAKNALSVLPSTLLNFHQCLVRRKYSLRFIERHIRTIRREFLDHTLFWNTVDLKRKLALFRDYYNRSRTHASLEGNTPAEISVDSVAQPASLHSYSWQKHCSGLFQLPVAA